MIRPYGGGMWPGRPRLGVRRRPESGYRYNPAKPESFGCAQDRLRSPRFRLTSGGGGLHCERRDTSDEIREDRGCTGVLDPV